MFQRTIRQLCFSCLVSFSTTNIYAGIYIDGGASVRDISRSNGTDETVTTTDMVIGYQDDISLPFGLGNANDNIHAYIGYRQSSYAEAKENNTTQWRLHGDFRKTLGPRWWMQYSVGYLTEKTDTTTNEFERISVGVKNGYHLFKPLLLTQTVRMHRTTYQMGNSTSTSLGYGLDAKFDPIDTVSIFVDYAFDEDYQHDFSLNTQGAEFTTLQAGFTFALNERSGFRLTYTEVDDGNTTVTITSTDFVLRY